ncbi:MAG TPA: glycine cleavage system protein GcvH [Candidatus Acidoferrales bacterium]
MYPENLRYTKDHEWIKIEGNMGTVGITDYAQHELGDIVYVGLPKKGEHFEAHGIFASVESVKAVSDVYCPAAGTVMEVNEALVNAPERINADPHGEGWLIKLELDKRAAGQDLLTAPEYEEYIKGAGE